jgi:hypothetical protein
MNFREHYFLGTSVNKGEKRYTSLLQPSQVQSRQPPWQNTICGAQ